MCSSLPGRSLTGSNMITKLKEHLWILIPAVIFITTGLLFWLMGAFLPEWIRWQNHERLTAERVISLKNRRLTVEQDGKEFYKTPLFTHVQDFLYFDINGDGEDELIMLVWKRGSYGEHKPTWVLRDEIDFSQHIFIYSFLEDRLKPIWMSSKLGIEVVSFDAPAERTIRLKEPDGTETDWVWLSFGLTLKE